MITPHLNGHAQGAPALGLSEMLKQKEALRTTGVDTTRTLCHHTRESGEVTYNGLFEFKTEREGLEALWTAIMGREENLGTLEELAAAIPAHLYTDVAKLKERNPQTAKSFAWQACEGYFVPGPEAESGASGVCKAST